MRQDIHFWFAVLARGFIALLAGSFIMVIPDMARSLLLLPIAIVISVLGLAVYGVLDSTLVMISSFMTGSRRAQSVMLIEGSIGVLIGFLFLLVVYDRVKLEWFLTLAALQALAAGAGEFLVARHTISEGASRWNYAAAIVALGAGVTCLVLRIHFATYMNPDRISWLVYAYLVAFGIAQCLTAARMIYADRQALIQEETARLQPSSATVTD